MPPVFRRVLRAWAMAVRAVSAKDLRRPGAVTIVAVPTSEWAPAACDAWIGLVSGHGNTGTAREHSVFYQRVEQTVVFVRDKSPPEYKRTLGDDVVASGMCLGQCLVGFSPDDGCVRARVHHYIGHTGRATQTRIDSNAHMHHVSSERRET
jgi:hypothetical protein